jgi:hypothetical protein
LHFHNFHFIAAELSDPDSFPNMLPANQLSLEDYGATVRHGVYQDLLDRIDPEFNDWLFLGARNDDDINSIHRLVAASLGTFRPNANFAWNDDTRHGSLEIDASIYASGTTQLTQLATLSVDAGPPTSGRVEGEDLASFSPQQKLTVVTAVKIVGDARFTSIVHSFQMVPEPMAASLAGFGGIVVLAPRRRRRRP